MRLYLGAITTFAIENAMDLPFACNAEKLEQARRFDKLYILEDAVLASASFATSLILLCYFIWSYPFFSVFLGMEGNL